MKEPRTYQVDSELHNRLKSLAATVRMTMTDAVNAALDAYCGTLQDKITKQSTISKGGNNEKATKKADR